MLRTLLSRLTPVRRPWSRTRREADRLIAEGNRAEDAGRWPEACARYRAAAAVAPGYARAHLNLGIALEALGDAGAATRSYETALAIDSEDPFARYNLGKLLYASGDLTRAERLVAAALERRPEFPEARVALAHIYDSQGKLEAAAAALLAALEGRPEYSAAWYARAVVLGKLGRAAEAETALRRTLALVPDHLDALKLLARACADDGRLDEAESGYRRAMALDPEDIDIFNSLGYVLAAQGRFDEAEALCRRAMALRPESADALCNLGNVCRERGRIEEAAACYRRAIANDPRAAEAQFNLGNVLKDQGFTAEAAARYRDALASRPDYAEARWALAMARIPVVYESGVEPSLCRAAFAAELEALERWFSGERSTAGARAVGAHQPFYLAYQEEDNRRLLERYGKLCSGLMQAWFARQDVARGPARPRRDVVRVGVVSRHFFSHSVWHAIVKGWFRHIDRRRFSVEAIYLGAAADRETAFARERSAHFTQGPRGLRQWTDAILGRRPDVLVYPEIGMDAMAVKLASLRLAPVQAASWGHPETTGLPTIDYYLSARGFEPDGAQDHYTEKLIQLPHLGCCYEPLRIEPVPPDVEGGSPILLCPGAPFKYAPQHDPVLVGIARRLGRCRLVFFTHRIAELSWKLKARLRDAFGLAGLDIERFTLFLPWQPAPAFHGWLRRADVFLDTVGFSGFNTAMQALECGLPIVAREGRFLRGRFASGLLRRIGLDELVARSDEEYAELAVRVCTDDGYRADLRRRIEANRAVLFEDLAPVRALEDWLAEAGTAARS